jgi:hypothetical protein
MSAECNINIDIIKLKDLLKLLLFVYLSFRLFRILVTNSFISDDHQLGGEEEELFSLNNLK